ncbi:DUF523 domain-containing protein [Marinisporobacter balticus]|uniref:Uncharacterized protein YbbK (DUF523 family) n=1 Tax=Marinisporobacter balticus TaxID=2018667 RepID=A0A4R2KM57_9FIRM|nr:DUF523 domain-containing protein [Marinisporobacter balticus]TCO73627.1 uncharacterized protein YbbK (DUF523 family) [Marinisporobacter balticus]
MILISACLAGLECRYDGGDNKIPEILKLVKEKKAILVCPEQLGGMATPRLPCEIIDGDGEDVLNNQAKVVNKSGEDVSMFFIKGAQETLKIAKIYGAKTAILKKRSPSCGSRIIYDGSFSGKKKIGDGVTVALLKREGIDVLDEENFETTIK